MHASCGWTSPSRRCEPCTRWWGGDTFHVSAERVCRLSLAGKPVVALSHKGGRVIAHSDEAKALGIEVGAPRRKTRHLGERGGLVPLSANFVLTGTPAAERCAWPQAWRPCSRLTASTGLSWLHRVHGDLAERAGEVKGRWMRRAHIGAAPAAIRRDVQFVTAADPRKPGGWVARLGYVS